MSNLRYSWPSSLPITRTVGPPLPATLRCSTTKLIWPATTRDECSSIAFPPVQSVERGSGRGVSTGPDCPGGGSYARAALQGARHAATNLRVQPLQFRWRAVAVVTTSLFVVAFAAVPA